MMEMGKTGIPWVPLRRGHGKNSHLVYYHRPYIAYRVGRGPWLRITQRYRSLVTGVAVAVRALFAQNTETSQRRRNVTKTQESARTKWLLPLR